MVKATKSKDDRSEISFAVAEAREYVQLLNSWRIVHVKREGNAIANELAHLARRNIHSAFWMGKAPACAQDLIRNDCNSVLA
ncbi:hypothetical protein BAE44_0009920 [Dichanthelium oligosanthes]|uniref:RNase H type-1 domain-containing protein n=1 Tax=Dichanthelium oligosanthes TaxID=888268 RepID=A0A1E5VVC2_9POAL|nr:hypothetical protein BAE44_0009920 [Dichanthelium oligosanthes]